MEQEEVFRIRCASCGMPARFDIARQIYRCQACGAETGIEETLKQRKGFQKLHFKRMNQPRAGFVSAQCRGCGARISFEESQALTTCAFCGQSLVRKAFLRVQDFPELLVPFRLQKEEARQKLLAWCRRHPLRREARVLKKHADQMEGYYLPYMLVQGPVSMAVQRRDCGGRYHARGFLKGMAVNTSEGISNQLLDGMEPFDPGQAREFDFSYVAGERVRMQDIQGKEAEMRIRDEIAEDYLPFFSRVMETRAIQTETDCSSLLAMPAVLPVYYVNVGGVEAAVNGQSGKTAVLGMKERYFLPWWLRPLGWTAVICCLVYLITFLISWDTSLALVMTGMLGLVFLLILLTAYHNAFGGMKRVSRGKPVFVSDRSRPHVDPPVFFESGDAGTGEIDIRFTTPWRVIRAVTLGLCVMVLPILLAFILNGFSMKGLDPAGAAVWMCITVPVVPVYLLKFGRLELYDRPILRRRDEKGRMKRFRKKKEAGSRIHFRPSCILAFLGVAALLIMNIFLVLSGNTPSE